MLTDRQSRFYNCITKLSLSKSTATDKERKYMLKAKQNIECGMRFQDSINALNLSLMSIMTSGNDESSTLTDEVRELFDKLTSIYGKPDYRELNNFGKNIQGGPYIGGFGF